MTNRKISTLLAGAAAIAMLLTGCSDAEDDTPAAPTADAAAAFQRVSGTAKENNATEGTGDWAYREGGLEKPEKKETSANWAELRAAKAGDLDPVVVNGADLTLYRFDSDEAKPSKSTCFDKCAELWPPVVVKPGAKVFYTGVEESKVGFLERDGLLQVTLGGWPLYRYSEDTKKGDTKGQGRQGTWFGITPDGGRAEGGELPNGADGAVEAPGGTDGGDEQQVMLFDKPDFGAGAAVTVSGKTCQDLPQAGIISSVKTTVKLRMWAQKGCKGAVREIDADVPDLGALDFDGAPASVRIL